MSVFSWSEMSPFAMIDLARTGAPVRIRRGHTPRHLFNPTRARAGAKP
jgi:hypothetical protein